MKSFFQPENTMAKVIRISTSIIIILAAIGGIIMSFVKVGYKTEFHFDILFTVWFSCFIFAILFFSISEIIELLHKQHNESMFIHYYLQRGVSSATGTKQSPHPSPAQKNSSNSTAASSLRG